MELRCCGDVKGPNMITASKRLVLRYYWPEDIAPIFKSYTGDLGSTKYLARHPHTEIEQTEKMLQNFSVPESMALTGKCIWVVDAIRKGGAIGLITVVSGNHIEVADTQQRRWYLPHSTCSQKITQ